MTNLKNDTNESNNLSRIYFWIGLSPIIISLLLSLLILILFKFLPSKLPLFYSLSWGDQQLATHQQFLIIPASLALIALLNLGLSWQLHSSQSFFKKVLLISPLIISLILVITFVKIVAIFI